VWVQEEPKNMGAWTHFAPRAETAVKGPNGNLKDTRRPRYIGRPTAGPVATGWPLLHKLEQSQLVKETFA